MWSVVEFRQRRNQAKPSISHRIDGFNGLLIRELCLELRNLLSERLDLLAELGKALNL